MLQIDMEMPRVCMYDNGLHSDCPMDRLWCAQKYAPKDHTVGQIAKDQKGKLPSWCPLKEVDDNEKS